MSTLFPILPVEARILELRSRIIIVSVSVATPLAVTIASPVIANLHAARSVRHMLSGCNACKYTA
jgi:hypothetical protein